MQLANRFFFEKSFDISSTNRSMSLPDLSMTICRHQDLACPYLAETHKGDILMMMEAQTISSFRELTYAEILAVSGGGDEIIVTGDMPPWNPVPGSDGMFRYRVFADGVAELQQYDYNNTLNPFDNTWNDMGDYEVTVVGSNGAGVQAGPGGFGFDADGFQIIFEPLEEDDGGLEETTDEAGAAN
jgi:hypothetical protein